MRFCIIAVAAFLFMTTSRSAFAEGCNPNDFKDVHLSEMTDMSRCAFLSSINKTDCAINRFKAGATIPVEGVPIAGNFETMKSQLQQFSRLTGTNQEHFKSESVMSVGWTEIGSQSFSDCLSANNDNSVVIKYPKASDLYTATPIIRIKWRHEQEMDAQPITVLCSGCADIKGLIAGSKIKPGYFKLIQIRRIPDTALDINIEVNGAIGQIVLPRPPRPLILRKHVWNLRIEANRANPATGQQMVAASQICMPSPPGAYTFSPAADRNFKLEAGEEFIIGSATVGPVSYSGANGTGPSATIDQQSADRVCWSLDFQSNDVHNGRVADYQVSVTTAKPQ